MNYYAIKAIYLYEMSRTYRTISQSLIAPVISTILYFVVFGSAIGSKIENSISQYFDKNNMPDPTANFQWMIDDSEVLHPFTAF